MRLKPNINVILDDRKANKEGLYPVKLCANFQVTDGKKKKWVDKYYPLDGNKYSYASEKDFNAVTSGTIRTDSQRELRNAIKKAERKAEGILEDHTFVNVELFDRLFALRGDIHTVGNVFNMIMAELKEADQVGTFLINKTTRNSVARFVDPNLKKMRTRKKLPDTIEINILFHEINSDWIKRYVKWLRDDGVGPTSAGMYLEVLRKVYNRAIDMRIANRDLYPFGKAGYSIKKPSARKIALSPADKDRLLALQDPEFRFSIDFWSMSFFSYGMNTTDIALLKIKDIHDDVINVPRQKTVNTSDARLVIPLRQEAKEVILRWGNKSLNPDDYVFPILAAGLTAFQQKNRITDFVDKVNDGLKKAGVKLELSFPLTTYTARHTFASIALENGASLEFIQKALGHKSLITTERYLSGFGIKTKRAMGERIYG